MSASRSDVAPAIRAGASGELLTLPSVSSPAPRLSHGGKGRGGAGGGGGGSGGKIITIRTNAHTYPACRCDKSYHKARYHPPPLFQQAPQFAGALYAHRRIRPPRVRVCAGYRLRRRRLHYALCTDSLMSHRAERRLRPVLYQGFLRGLRLSRRREVFHSRGKEIP